LFLRPLAGQNPGSSLFPKVARTSLRVTRYLTPLPEPDENLLACLPSV
jgi:hypothetical protein